MIGTVWVVAAIMINEADGTRTSVLRANAPEYATAKECGKNLMKDMELFAKTESAYAKIMKENKHYRFDFKCVEKSKAASFK